MTQSPETLADAAQLAMVAESVQKEAELEENASLKSTVTELTSGLKTLTAKMEDLQKRPLQQPTHQFYPRRLDAPRRMSSRPLFPTAVTGGHQPTAYRPLSNRQPSRDNSSTLNDASLRCWHCDQQGHQQRNCPARFHPLQASTQNRYGANSYLRLTCYGCNQIGHVRRDCPHVNRRPF